MNLLERIVEWDARRAAVELVCAEAHDLGFTPWEIRQLRRSAYYLSRTYGDTPAHHAKAALRGMVDARHNSATSRTKETR